MRLEFLPDGSPECPLIRLFDFTPKEARQLALVVANLADEKIEQALLHELAFVTPIDGCQLRLCLGSRDEAVRKVGRNTFDCRLTAGTWDNVAGSIEPFAAGGIGFQWLAGVPGEAALLLSVSGQW